MDLTKLKTQSGVMVRLESVRVWVNRVKAEIRKVIPGLEEGSEYESEIHGLLNKIFYRLWDRWDENNDSNIRRQRQELNIFTPFVSL